MNAELVSLNDELYDNFFVQELEERLETDPLMIGGMLDLVNQQDASAAAGFCFIQCSSEQNICSPVTR